MMAKLRRHYRGSKLTGTLTSGPRMYSPGGRDRATGGTGWLYRTSASSAPHPVPCADACPEDAIVVAPPGNSRVVDPNKCNGCKICLKACPWDMISFDPDSHKATKCFLCNGKPKCVEACPAESLSYVPWRDLTNKVPHRIATTAVIPPRKERGLPGVPPARCTRRPLDRVSPHVLGGGEGR